MIVVDTNVVAYTFLEGSKTALARKVADKDPAWRLPDVWRHEFLNILATYVKEGGLELARAAQLWQVSTGLLGPQTRAVDMPDALQLAVANRISAYDAQFVALALGLGVRLVTEDKQLLKTFRSTAVSMREFLIAR